MAAKYFNPYTDFGYQQYKKSLVQYLEVKNVFDTAFEEGEKAGIEKGIANSILIKVNQISK